MPSSPIKPTEGTPVAQSGDEDLRRDFERARDALWSGDWRELSAWIARRPEVALMEEDGQTLLHSAILMGTLAELPRPREIMALIEISNVNQQDSIGLTPFMMLAGASERLCDGKAFSRALALGGDALLRDNEGQDAMMHAAFGAWPKHVQALESLSDPGVADRNGNTALILAAGGAQPRDGGARDQAQCVRLLMPRWSAEARNIAGATALLAAVAEGNLHCVKELWAGGGADAMIREHQEGSQTLLNVAIGRAARRGGSENVAECMEFLCARMPRAAAMGAAEAFGLNRLPAFCALLESEALADAVESASPRPSVAAAGDGEEKYPECPEPSAATPSRRL